MEHWATTFRKAGSLPSLECLAQGRHSARCRRSKAYRLPKVIGGLRVSPPGPRVEPTPAAIAAAITHPSDSCPLRQFAAHRHPPSPSTSPSTDQPGQPQSGDCQFAGDAAVWVILASWLRSEPR